MKLLYDYPHFARMTQRGGKDQSHKASERSSQTPLLWNPGLPFSITQGFRKCTLNNACEILATNNMKLEFTERVN